MSVGSERAEYARMTLLPCRDPTAVASRQSEGTRAPSDAGTERPGYGGHVTTAQPLVGG